MSNTINTTDGFNNIINLPEYKRTDQVRDFLDRHAEGIRGRLKKGYPAEDIAKVLQDLCPDETLRKKITARRVRMIAPTKKRNKSPNSQIE